MKDFQKNSAIQNLCEINFVKSKDPKSAILTIFGH